MARNLTLPNNEGIAPPLDPSPLSADEAIRIVSDLREQRQQRAENAKKARAVQVAMMYRVASLVFGDDPAWLALVSTFQAQLPDVPINPRKRINTLCKFVNGPDDTGAVKLNWSQAHRRAYVLLELAARQVPVGQAYDYLMKVANLQMLADSWKRRRAGKLAATVPGSAEGATQGGKRLVMQIPPELATVLEEPSPDRLRVAGWREPSEDGSVVVTLTETGEATNPAEVPPVLAPDGWMMVDRGQVSADVATLLRQPGERHVMIEVRHIDHQHAAFRFLPPPLDKTDAGDLMPTLSLRAAAWADRLVATWLRRGPQTSLASLKQRGFPVEVEAEIEQFLADWLPRRERQSHPVTGGGSAPPASDTLLRSGRASSPVRQPTDSSPTRPIDSTKPAVAPLRGPTGRGTLGPQPPGWRVGPRTPIAPPRPVAAGALPMKPGFSPPKAREQQSPAAPVAKVPIPSFKARVVSKPR